MFPDVTLAILQTDKKPSHVIPHRRFPDFYYPLSFNIPNSNATIDFVMIDTVVLCGQADDVILHPEGPEDVKAAASQWVWIDEQLRSSKYVTC